MLRRFVLLGIPVLLGTLSVTTPLEAQRRGGSSCDPCGADSARLGFTYETQWQRDGDDRWRETITVRRVREGAPAAGRLEDGDVILRVNGLVATTQLFWSLRRTLSDGDSVHLRIRRGDREREVTLILPGSSG